MRLVVLNNPVDAIEMIGKLSKMIINAIDYIDTAISNPEIILTFIDEMTIVIVISSIVLKLMGFKRLEKWVMLSILIKVVASVL